MKAKLLSIILTTTILLSSCSITKMRYSRGLNIEFFKRGDKQDNSIKHASKAIKKVNTNSNVEINKFDVILAENDSKVLNENNERIIKNDKSIISNYYIQHTANYANKSYEAINNPSDLTPKVKHIEQPAQYVDEKKSGAWGIVGFICGILGIFILGFSILGIIFSCFGIGRRRKLIGLAITGLVISIICFVILILAIALV